MSETLQEFIVRRRGELDADASRLEVQLRAIKAEREKVDKVAMMFADEPQTKLPQTDHLSETANRLLDERPTRAARRVSEATIKELVLQALNGEEGDGFTALHILDQIRVRTGIDYPRTSLSPQLSRLKAEGKIHREGRYWSLGPDPGDGLDDEQPEDGDEQAGSPDKPLQNDSAPHP